MAETQLLPGGWTPLHELSGRDREIFSRAIQGLVGVRYQPLLVATQVVAGTNYNFICNAEPVYPNPPVFAACVQIFAPLSGDPHVTEITRIP